MQITLIGSDGKGYTFLAKPKDDLRKDHRMMEVAGVINRLFAREPVSRRRNLYLRRYASAGSKGQAMYVTSHPAGHLCAAQSYSEAGHTCSCTKASAHGTHCGVMVRDAQPGARTVDLYWEAQHLSLWYSAARALRVALPHNASFYSAIQSCRHGKL